MFKSKTTAHKPGAFESVFGEGLEIEGTIKSKGSLRIDGKLKGKISCDADLMIGEGAVLEADIEAVNITIAGDVTGNIRCGSRLELLSSGRLEGDTSTGSLVISEGAMFSGASNMRQADDNFKGATLNKKSESNVQR